MAEALPPNVPAVKGPAPSQPRRSSMILGGLLVFVGAVLLIGQFVRIDVGHYGWPFFVIAPGVVILFVALTARGAVGEGLAILGSIITVTGVILLYQNATDHFESWAYAWALIFPGAVGAGMILYGLAAGRPGNMRAGTRLVGIGVVLFLLGVAFFEGIIGIGGYQFGRSAGVAVGALIIVMGALLLILNLTSSRRHPR
jgi:hypothetical protein